MSKRMAVGALWMVLFKLLERGLSLISTLILARLLVPKDFGIVAMATSLIALIELISSFGLDTALIQRRDPSVGHYNAAWTMNVIAGCAVGLLMAAISVPASNFYREPHLVLVIITLGLCSAIQGFENVGVVDFRRELQFDKEFRYLLTKKLAGFIITVPLAFWLRNYWALVLGMLATRVIVLGYSFMAHPFRPRFSLASAPDLMHFSKWLMTLNLLTFLRERSADFIIGRVANSATLGTFSVAAQIASMPSTELVAPINRAILPAYVKLADDKVALGRQYLSVMGMISMIAVPAVAGLAATAPLVVLLVLGPTWREAIPVLEVLAFFGITQVLQTNAYSAFLALGKPKVFATINSAHVVVLITSLLLLTPKYGIMGAAWAYLIAAMLVLPINFGMITHFLGIRPMGFVSSVWRPMAASALMYFCVRWLSPMDISEIHSSLEALRPVIVSVAIGIAVYAAAIALLWFAVGRPEGAETWLLGEVRKIAGKLRGAPRGGSGASGD